MKKHVKAVHDKIRDFACESCDYTASTNAQIKTHVKAVHDKIKNYACDHCEYRATVKHTLEDHVKVKHENIKDLTCDQCDYKTGLKSGLRYHIKTRHKDITDPKIPDLTLLKCPKCEYSTNYWSNLSDHVATFHKKLKIFSCDSCNYGTHRSGDYKKHIKAMHDKKKDFSCGYCEYKGTWKRDLEDHVQTKHIKNGDFPCGQCHYKAKSRIKMAKHMKNVHGKIWTCDQCPYKTGRRDSLMRHALAVHNDFTKLACKECDFNAANAKVLKNHIKGVHQLSNRIQKCPLCKFETNRGRSGIELHLKSRHYKIKDLACSFCDHRFTYKQKLQKHVKIMHPDAEYLPSNYAPSDLEHQDNKAFLEEILNMPLRPMEEYLDLAIKTEVKNEGDERSPDVHGGRDEVRPEDSAKEIGVVSRRSRVFKYRNPFFRAGAKMIK